MDPHDSSDIDDEEVKQPTDASPEIISKKAENKRKKPQLKRSNFIDVTETPEMLKKEEAQ